MRSDELVMACLPAIVKDMYLGLCRNYPSCTEESIQRAATIYHDEKWGLSNAGSTAVPVEDTVFFLLKKCVYHWMVGTRLYLECCGFTEQEAQNRAASSCSKYLHGEKPEDCDRWYRIKARYNAKISQQIQRVYAEAGNVPSNEWCAWLELEAVKMAVACEKEDLV